MEYFAEESRTDKALKMAAEQLFNKHGGDRSYSSNVLLVITDSNASPRSEPYHKVLSLLQVKTILLVVVVVVVVVVVLVGEIVVIVVIVVVVIVVIVVVAKAVVVVVVVVVVVNNQCVVYFF